MRSGAINTLISDLQTENIEPLTDTAIGDDIVELRRTSDRLEFEISRRVDLFARRRGYVAFGFVNLVSWLRRACRLMPGVAIQQLLPPVRSGPPLTTSENPPRPMYISWSG